MKKIIVAALLVLLVVNVNAQKRRGGGTITWLSLAIKGGYGTSVFLNKETMDDSNVDVNLLSPAMTFGGRFGLTFGDQLGVSFELLSSNYSQILNPKNGMDYYKKEFKMKALEYAVLFRFTGETGFYAELGPKFTKVKSISETNSVTGTGRDLLSELDYQNKFVKSYTSALLGFGFMPIRTDRFTLSLGIRGTYSLNNLIADENFHMVDDNVYNPTTPYTNNKTNPISGLAILELNYFFGQYGNANCGKSKIQFFK